MLRFVHLTLQQFSDAHLAMLFAGFFLAVGLVALYEAYRLLGRGTRWRLAKNALVAALLVLYLLAVADIALLGRGDERAARVVLVPFVELADAQQRGKFLVYDALNAAMFVPLTFLVSSLELGGERAGTLSRRGERACLAVAALASALIEVTQLACGIGTFETEDFICNMLGALVGLGLYRAWVRLRYAPSAPDDEPLLAVGASDESAAQNDCPRHAPRHLSS